MYRAHPQLCVTSRKILTHVMTQRAELKQAEASLVLASNRSLASIQKFITLTKEQRAEVVKTQEAIAEGSVSHLLMLNDELKAMQRRRGQVIEYRKLIKQGRLEGDTFGLGRELEKLDAGIAATKTLIGEISGPLTEARKEVLKIMKFILGVQRDVTKEVKKTDDDG